LSAGHVRTPAGSTFAESFINSSRFYDCSAIALSAKRKFSTIN